MSVLKEQSPSVRSVLADPKGSALYRYVKTGSPEVEGEGSITEGIGSTRVTASLEGTPSDDAYSIPDQEAVTLVYRMLHEKGLFLGSSSGINVAAAARLARDPGPGHTIATLLCDGGARYYSRLFNPDWLREKGLDPDRR